MTGKVERKNKGQQPRKGLKLSWRVSLFSLAGNCVSLYVWLDRKKKDERVEGDEDWVVVDARWTGWRLFGSARRKVRNFGEGGEGGVFQTRPIVDKRGTRTRRASAKNKESAKIKTKMMRKAWKTSPQRWAFWLENRDDGLMDAEMQKESRRRAEQSRVLKVGKAEGAGDLQTFQIVIYLLTKREGSRAACRIRKDSCCFEAPQALSSHTGCKEKDPFCRREKVKEQCQLTNVGWLRSPSVEGWMNIKKV